METLLMILFGLLMMHGTAVAFMAIIWLSLPWWAVFVGPVLGFAAYMLLILILASVQALWWRWWNQRLSQRSSIWLARIVAYQPFPRRDDGV